MFENRKIPTYTWVKMYGIETFEVKCMLYKSLELYRNTITKIEMWSWWVFAHYNPEYIRKTRILYRIIVSQSCLRCDVQKYDKTSKLRTLCDELCTETPYHMLFQCSRFEKEHEKWKMTLKTLPKGLCKELKSMKSKQLLECVCKGFNCNYISEWHFIYKNIIDYIYYMYNIRKNIE